MEAAAKPPAKGPGTCYGLPPRVAYEDDDGGCIASGVSAAVSRSQCRTNGKRRRSGNVKMSGLRQLGLVLLLSAGFSTAVVAQNSQTNTTGTSPNSAPSNPSGHNPTGTGNAPQVTCFGRGSVLTCLDASGGPPFQVNCFGSSQFQSCFSFQSGQQFSLSSLGAANPSSGTGSSSTTRGGASAPSGSTSPNSAGSTSLTPAGPSADPLSPTSQ